ncbi:hypothetical protein VFPFJ_08962 [Purpureocillium lilacinum]|uniref:Uncharacterized protein n=1 Tax=Purpureocillium lilacinum TaxID=33203 RepID=A0A179H195_PURLI|nr:hypothetical protein VFPFJ_08962 [Purpureocillium lilacinum]OAQ83159.1 hypothetical protein VFPFJ_08962 [Purpureocillium lilacinum]
MLSFPAQLPSVTWVCRESFYINRTKTSAQTSVLGVMVFFLELLRSVYLTGLPALLSSLPMYNYSSRFGLIPGIPNLGLRGPLFLLLGLSLWKASLDARCRRAAYETGR